MSNYRAADTKAQWFQDNYPGADLHLSADTTVVCFHTTESMGWPGYEGGATAPNYTAKPNIKFGILDWRAHFPDEKSSRALRNLSGGVETNTLNTIQVELVGTCDPSKRFTWAGLKAGVDYIYWPDAPPRLLKSLARFLVDMHKRHGLQLKAPTFLAYPASYGASPVRFTFAQWRNFAGVCGHQHVPENSHGDPGDLDIKTLLALAEGILNPPSLRVISADLTSAPLTRRFGADVVFQRVAEVPSLDISDDQLEVLDSERVKITPRRSFVWAKVKWRGRRFLLISRRGDQRHESWLPTRILNYRKEMRAIEELAAAWTGDVIVGGSSLRLTRKLGLTTVAYGRNRVSVPNSLDIADQFTASAPGAESIVILDLEKPR